ncbi:bacillithiol biosynthesis deacetylase BshB1 [Mechercharimyces sp. CAU 1602]|uniref:bacillithiol biosynthesis deacetylase BshB1 n=1 Tax=Mechercharimyces sp. CAU 1602 TaxID=2973933 RepID=UPI0021610C10|nr:bacillithiol biosynthesis deacetylase BshB1 [Mechercharimyces sp. CAU 1602]MCS1351010.1 bacillithiol biosynthesis deacetylase BshB1 [Mechercharimyces sp. CAU 1602]
MHNEMITNILAFGAHPDDVEIGAGGILAKHTSAGYRAAICDLTAAELSSNGNPILRQQEAEQASHLLGLHTRINLGIADRAIGNHHSEDVAAVIRRLRPEIVLLPFGSDRHPDHVAAHHLIQAALFDAGIGKKEIGGLPPHRVNKVYCYFINQIAEPDIIVDISDVYEKKTKAIHAYQSQFFRGTEEVATPLNQGTYLQMIQGRDQLWGHQIGVSYGEGLATLRPLAMPWLLDQKRGG